MEVFFVIQELSGHMSDVCGYTLCSTAHQERWHTRKPDVTVTLLVEKIRLQLEMTSSGGKCRACAATGKSMAHHRVEYITVVFQCRGGRPARRKSKIFVRCCSLDASRASPIFMVDGSYTPRWNVKRVLLVRQPRFLEGTMLDDSLLRTAI